MRKDDFIRLQHMLGAAKDSIDFIAGKSRSDLENDRLLAYGIIKAVEIIGEAASKISKDGHDQFPEIPWQDTIGMRNRLVHVYFGIDYDQVWDTVTKDIPPLILRLESILVSHWQPKEE